MKFYEKILCGTMGCIPKFLRIMKIIIIILTTAVLHVSAAGYAQRITLSEKNAAISKIFDQISIQSGYDFFYNFRLIDQAKPVSITVKDADINDVLKVCFRNQPFTYSIKEYTVIVKLKGKGLTEVTDAIVQAINVKGKVIDEKGLPLPGVTIKIKGTKNVTVTDANGQFVIDVESGAVLIISAVGYTTREVTVGSENNLAITLDPAENKLEQVMVVGYKSIQKKDLTGSASELSVTKEIAQIPTTNLSVAIAGRIPGVNVTQSGGKPGRSASINIRGATVGKGAALPVGRFAGSSEPLYVIDNIISTKQLFDALDASMVESVTVLKDAASAAVYGARAANGVIVVTTKSGKKGVPQVNITSTLGTTEFTRIPKMLSPYENALLINGRMDLNGNVPANDLARINPTELEYLKGINYGSMLDQNKRHPILNRNTATVSGGTDKVDYLVSGSFVTEGGLVQNLNYNKTNLLAKVNVEIAPGLRTGLNLSHYKDKGHEFYWFYNSGNLDLENFYQTSIRQGHWVPQQMDGKYVGNFLGWNGGALINEGQGYQDYNANSTSAIVNVDYDIPFVKGLQASLIYNTRQLGNDRTIFRQPLLTYTFPNDPNNRFKLISDPNNPPTQVIRLDGGADANSIQESTNKFNTYQMDAKLSYKNTFGDHSINALFVYEQFESKYKDFYGRRRKVATPLVPYLDGASSSSGDQFAGGGATEDGRLSYIGSVDYNYKRKYYISGSFRSDASVQFAPNKRYGLFPSGAIAWVLSEENFMKNAKVLNFLKLRFSVGKTGDDVLLDANDNPIRFPYRQFYNAGGSATAIFGTSDLQSIPVVAGLVPDSAITWSTQTSFDLGIDFEMLNRRLSGTIDLYKNKKRNLFGSKQIFIPSSSGISLQNTNYGGIDISGIDVQLNYNGSITKDLSFRVGGNAGYSNAVYQNIEQPGTARPYEILNGQKVNRLLLLDAAGIIRTKEELDKLIASGYTWYGEKPQLGDLYYKDVRGQFANDPQGNSPDGIVNDDDRTYSNKLSAPPFNYGMNFSLTYKNFTLDVFMQGFAGGYRYKTASALAADSYPAQGLWDFWKDSYSPTNTNAMYPAIAGTSWWTLASRASTFTPFLQKTDFLRLKNINLAYALPKSFINKLSISSASIFFTATNLFYLYSSVKDYDPETNGLGVPLTKSYNMGINVNF